MVISAFDPDNITQDQMDTLADNIDGYLHMLKSIMIIPEEIQHKYGDQIKVSIKKSEKLVKKLRAGDRSVFKDVEDSTDVFN